MDSITPFRDLGETETHEWRDRIGEIRKNKLKKPADYVTESIAQLKKKADCHEPTKDISSLILAIKECVWNAYLRDEKALYSEAVEYLLKEDKGIHDALKQLLDETIILLSFESSKDKASNEIIKVFKEYFEAIHPYLYELMKSTTQSRRSRTGKVFELIIEHIIKEHKFSYKMQAAEKVKQSGGLKETKKETKSGLKETKKKTKNVDFVIWSNATKQTQGKNCFFLTLKTTLRERWQQVVEELKYSGEHGIFLLTLDEKFGAPTLEGIKNNNINLVVLKKVKDAYKDNSKIMSFEDLFLDHIPHTMKQVKRKEDR